MKKLLLLLLLVPATNFLQAQCTNTSAYSSVSAPTNGGTVQVGSCHYASENSLIANAVSGANYVLYSSVSTDYFTVTQGSANGPVVTHGNNPLQWSAPANGNYYVHVTANASCQLQSTCRQIYLVHNPCAGPPPTINVNVSPGLNICAGTQLTVTASGANSYTWYPGGVVAFTVYAAPTSNSSFTVLGGSGGCIGATIFNITVSQKPTIFASAPTNVCPGHTFTLNAGGGQSYSWLPGNMNGGTVTTSQSTTVQYTVTGTNAAGCTNTDVVTVGLLPVPTIGANSPSATVCSGITTTLNATGGISYTWAPGSNTLSTYTVAPTASTNYTVTGKGTNGCTASGMLQITALPLPSVVLTPAKAPMCVGESNTITATGATSYMWLSDFSTNPTLVVTATSTLGNVYNAIGTDQNGCKKEVSITLSVVMCSTATAIGENQADVAPSVYPNPNNGTFVIKTGAAIDLRMVNEMGQVVLEIPAGSTEVNATSLTPGIYLLVGRGANTMVYNKIIISH